MDGRVKPGHDDDTENYPAFRCRAAENSASELLEGGIEFPGLGAFEHSDDLSIGLSEILPMKLNSIRMIAIFGAAEESRKPGTTSKCAQVRLVIASEAKQSRPLAQEAGLLRRHSPSKTGVNALLPRNDEIKSVPARGSHRASAMECPVAGERDHTKCGGGDPA